LGRFQEVTVDGKTPGSLQNITMVKNLLTRLALLLLTIAASSMSAMAARWQPLLKPLDFMIIEEPQSMGSIPNISASGNSNADREQRAAVMGDSDLELNQKEVESALRLRLKTQRAIRFLQAQRISIHRHQGRTNTAFRRELEAFLEEQKNLRVPTLLKKSGTPKVLPQEWYKSVPPVLA